MCDKEKKTTVHKIHRKELETGKNMERILRETINPQNL